MGEIIFELGFEEQIRCLICRNGKRSIQAELTVRANAWRQEIKLGQIIQYTKRNISK